MLGLELRLEPPLARLGPKPDKIGEQQKKADECRRKVQPESCPRERLPLTFPDRLSNSKRPKRRARGESDEEVYIGKMKDSAPEDKRDGQCSKRERIDAEPRRGAD